MLTSNSGFPLDQNLYQTVKGMSAAAQVVSEGGLILAAAECGDGFPDHGSFKRFLFDHPSAQAMLDTINRAPEPIEDQWQVQLLALSQGATAGLNAWITRDDSGAIYVSNRADNAYVVKIECP